MTTTKQASRITALVGGLVLAVGTVAWACTPQTSMFALNPPGDRPRNAAVTVTGDGVPAGQAVQIFWNDVKGPKLAEVVAAEKQSGAHSTGAFSAQITIPDVAPGIYYILAASNNTGVARLAFEVTAPESAPQPSESTTRDKAVDSGLWSGFSQGSGLVSEPAASGSPADGSRPAGVGMALFSLGAAALAAGGGIAVLRRRRLTNREL